MSDNEHDLIIGRFQPIHNGHVRIIRNANSPVVAVIGHSHADKRNPLSLPTRMSMVKRTLPDVTVINADTGYIPSIIEDLHVPISRVIAGDDRADDYRNQLSRANMDVPVVTMTRGGSESSTKVRELVVHDDLLAFMRMVPRSAWSSWGELRHMLTS